MRFLKGLIALSVIMSVITTSICFSDAAQESDFTDDFSYGPLSNVTGGGKLIGNNWQSSVQADGQGSMVAWVNGAPDDKKNEVLYIQSNYTGAVDLVAPHSGISSKKVYQADIRSSVAGSNQQFGIMATTAIGGSELANRYQLTCAKGTCFFVKQINYADQHAKTAPNTIADTSKWYTFKMIFDGSNISWSITEKGGSLFWAGSYTDPSPLNITNLMLHTNGTDSATACFDNVAYREYQSYVFDGEPENVLYLNTAYNKQTIAATEAANGSSVVNANDGDINTKFITNGTGTQQYAVDLGQKYVIRRLQILGLGSNTANLGNDLYIQASNDESFGVPVDIVRINTSLINNGNFDWVNTVEFSPYRYVRLIRKESGDSLGFGECRVLTDIDENDTINIFTRSKAECFLRMNRQDNTDIAVWTSSVPAFATVSGGLVSGVTDGSALITASLNNVALTTNVKVIGEITLAQQNGTVQQYVESKSPIIEAINNAMTAKNTTSLKAIIFGTVAPSLSQILDFNYDNIKDYNEDKIDALINSLITYQPFCQSNGTISLENIENMIQSLNIEIAVGELDNIADAITISDLLIKNNDYYSLNLEDEYYLKYKDIVLTSFENHTFKNVTDLKECFIKAYIMPAFKGTISYKMIKGIIEDIKTGTDIDFSHYDNIDDKDEFYMYLIENKSSINTLEDIISYTNNYTPAPTPTPKPEKSRSGSGGSSSVIRIDPIPEQLPVIVQEESLYPDIAISDWAYEGVKFLTAKKAVKGYENGNFEPNNEVTRAEFIKMLLVSFEIPLQTEGDVFTDVNNDDWYYQYMLTTKANKILLGDFNNICNPNSYITRQEMAALVYRTLNTNKMEINNINEPVIFTDADEIPDWAYTAVMKLQSAGIISGMENGSFQPLGLATRAQASKVIYQAVTKTQNTISEGAVK